MTIQSASSSISLPLSALLPPQSPNNPIAPHHLLPPSPSAAILGPLPPTTPLHLALNWLALSDLPEYESALSAITPARNDPILASKDDDIVPKIEGTGGSGRRKRVRPRPERVLIITGRKDEFYQALQDEDEDWMRDHGSDYSVIDRLKRVDVRYCPSPQHLTLLLSLLTTSASQSTTSTATSPAKNDGAYTLSQSPGLVVLWDLAALLMEWEGEDENVLPDDDGMGDYLREMGDGSGPRLAFRKNAKLSDYLDMIAAARSTVNHFSLGDVSRPSTQLIVLEPNLDGYSSLPVLPPPSASAGVDTTMSSQIRQKRIKLKDGLKWMLSEDAVGLVSEPDSQGAEDTVVPQYQLAFDTDSEKVVYMNKKRCGRGEWARPSFRESETEGDQGGWRWEWA